MSPQSVPASPSSTPKAAPAKRAAHQRRRGLGLTKLSVASALIAALLLVPLAGVAVNFFVGDAGTWAHLARTVLAELIGNSLLLAALVALGVGVLGTAMAWISARYEFPGRASFEWLLILPLAMPAYVMAYVYTDLLQYAGPVQTWLRAATGWSGRGDYWFPEVRSLGGAALMLTLALYPYVYMLARVAFLEQSNSLVEAGRTFGYSRWRIFRDITLPMARPAMAAGIALALMETLADFGTVSYFGVPTFTTGIFNAWFSQGDRVAAAKLALLLLVFVFAVIWIERRSWRRARFFSGGGSTPRRIVLSGRQGWGASLLCAAPLLLGFLLPAVLLARLALDNNFAGFGPRFVTLAGNSFTIAIATALIAVLLALLLAYAARRAGSRWPVAINQLVGMGYAIPGMVIAVGVLVPITRFDHAFTGWVEWLTGRTLPLLLTGGVVVLVYAYLIRFLGIALQSVDAGLAKITPRMDEAARALGASDGEVARRIHAPLLKKSLVTAGLLVFVDVMKELPATLVMRPFNFDTLAVQAYTLAMDERLAEASVAALAIVAVGLIPVIFASRAITQAEKG